MSFLVLLGWCSCCGQRVAGMEPRAYPGKVQLDYHITTRRELGICIGSRSVMRRWPTRPQD